MEAATWGFIGTLAGAIIGAAASIVTTVLTSRNAIHLQRETDSLERSERARAFQRDNLLEMQDALQDALRLMGRAHLEDQAAFRREGNWGRGMLSDDTDENIRLANRRLSALVERVADDSLRSKLKDIHKRLNRPLFATSEEEAQALFGDATSAAQGVMEHLGEVLRNQY